MSHGFLSVKFQNRGSISDRGGVNAEIFLPGMRRLEEKSHFLLLESDMPMVIGLGLRIVLWVRSGKLSCWEDWGKRISACFFTGNANSCSIFEIERDSCFKKTQADITRDQNKNLKRNRLKIDKKCEIAREFKIPYSALCDIIISWDFIKRIRIGF